MAGLFADASLDWADAMKLLFSAGSLGVTVYFWFVRINRERVSVGVFPAGGFEGRLEPGSLGVWTGKVYLANRSILPTAVVAGEVELLVRGRWQKGGFHTPDGSELPWNLPPSQAYAKSMIAAFDLPADTPTEWVYANRKLRITLITVEGARLVNELSTHAELAAAA